MTSETVVSTVLITGANRGIGLELATQYAAEGWQVFAAARDPAGSKELQALTQTSRGQVRELTMDVADTASVRAAATTVGDAPIDVLINNAGVIGNSKQRIGAMDYDAWAQVLNINTMGALRVTEAFLENLASSKRRLAIAITSGMGSLADNTSGGYIDYRTSKAALNMVMRTLAIDLAPRRISCIVINPGWVKTRMGGASANLPVSESVKAMRKVFDRAGMDQTGKFFNWDGKEYPW